MCSHAFIWRRPSNWHIWGVSWALQRVNPVLIWDHHSPSLCWEVSSSYQAWLHNKTSMLDHKQDMLKNPKWFDHRSLPLLRRWRRHRFFQLGVEIKLVSFSLPSIGMLFAAFCLFLWCWTKHLAKVHGNGQYANLVSYLIVSSVLLWNRKTHPSFSVFRFEDRQFLWAAHHPLELTSKEMLGLVLKTGANCHAWDVDLGVNWKFCNKSNKKISWRTHSWSPCPVTFFPSCQHSARSINLTQLPPFSKVHQAHRYLPPYLERASSRWDQHHIGLKYNSTAEPCIHDHAPLPSNSFLPFLESVPSSNCLVRLIGFIRLACGNFAPMFLLHCTEVVPYTPPCKQQWTMTPVWNNHFAMKLHVAW